MRVTPIRLRLSNAYLIEGDRPMLVDSGSPGEAPKIMRALATVGVRISDLAAIIHTHVHSDHVGSTVELRRESGAPVAYHPADEPIMRRGDNGPLAGIGLRGRMLVPFFSHTKFPTFAPDFPLVDGLRLEPYGVAGTILHTPGHTAGSISVLLDTGAALIGDVLMGGELGGYLLAPRPRYHYFAENLSQVQSSLRQILAAVPHTLYVGHGGPVAAAEIHAALGEFLQAREVEQNPVERAT
jgi:glyoxylase-like metal-dependent hydrolase (beta-lactamase superfamily II)